MRVAPAVSADRRAYRAAAPAPGGVRHPRRQTELMALLGVTHRTQFRTFHLQPLIDGGLAAVAVSRQSPHPRQRYSLTPAGAAIVGRQIKADGASG